MLAVLWLATGAAMVAVPTWLGLTRWRVVLSGHPALLATAISCGFFGLVAIIWGLASLVSGSRFDAGDDRRAARSLSQLRRQATVRLVFGVPALVLCVLLTGALVWSRPLPADDLALAALRDSSRVRVIDRITWYELVPSRRSSSGVPVTPTVGFVFVPGARVDPRAYARVLRPLAEAGFLVVVLKEPMNIALPNSGHAGRPMELFPQVRYWAVGGHSLGGVAAATYADRTPKVTGLVLYASYPVTTIARRNLKVTSISGDADALTTPAEIADSKKNLPKSTRYVVLKGAVHSFFGDYGPQPGDGEPRLDRARAQAHIVANTRALLASLVPPPKKR